MHAIEVHAVSKSYRIAHERQTRLAERMLSLFRPVPVEHFPAIVDVTLQVPLDSFVGIIGRNGSGKSTLLKLIAGLLVPDTGEIHVQGRIAPVLELGLGFGLDFSGNLGSAVTQAEQQPAARGHEARFAE